MSRLDAISNWEMDSERAHFNVTELARICGVSAGHLRRFLSGKMRQSPQKWLKQQRLEKAKGLLASSLSVKEVAAKLYFADTAQLCHQFKFFFGCTPSEYRSRLTSHL
jgi:AraC-like DNA-binding protein